MIAYEIDPTLHTKQPHEESLDDGFSRPRHGESQGVHMATHPVEPEQESDGSDPAPNPTHLPVEPDFAPLQPPVEPEDPRGKPPAL